jgi:hypothetical protein
VVAQANSCAIIMGMASNSLPTTTTKTFVRPLNALDARFEAQKIAFGPVVFQCVRIANKWGVLECLDRAESGCTLADLAIRLGRSEYALSVLLESCLSAGVVSVDGAHFRIEKIGRFVLHDELTRVNFEFVQEICYSGMMALEAALADGHPAGLKALGPWETIYRGLRDLPEASKRAWFDFDHHYSDSAFAAALPLVFQNRPARLMDVGANTGKWARQCLEYDDAVQMTLVDLPEQIGVARESLRDHASRIRYCEVDVLDAAVAFPGDQDAVWMSQFLSCFGAETILGILQRAAASLLPGGRVFVLDTFWDRQRFDIAAYCIINTSPYFTAIANGVSKMYRSQEYIELAALAGLRLVDVRDEIGLSHSLLVFACAGSPASADEPRR